MTSLKMDTPNLNHLQLNGCQFLASFQGDAGPVTELNLYNCRTLSLDALMRLISSTEGNIRRLDMTGMIQLTDDCLDSVYEMCPMLERIELQGCKGLSV